jgi:hypothetical protein
MSNTIDLTPTWAGVLPALLAVLESGTNEGKKMAREELAKMAKGLDRCNAVVPALLEALEGVMKPIAGSDKAPMYEAARAAIDKARSKAL